MNTVRLSEAYPDEFQRYMDLFIKYFPKKSFFIKESYTLDWIQKKKKDSDLSLPLFPSLATETVERHLDATRSKDWRVFNGKKSFGHPIWLGLNPSQYSYFDAIDVDAKDYIIGYYSSSPRKLERQPVVLIGLAHFQKLKRIYDCFPNRIWCISSETLGLHIWSKNNRLKKLKDLYRDRKVDLASIGMEKTEVHPMIGRCFRRPFGKDYRTISSKGIIDKWQDQLAYFDDPNGDYPSFRQIVMALLKSMIRQANAWKQSKYAYNLDQNRIKKIPIARIKNEIDLIYKWLKNGCHSVNPTPSFKNVPSNYLFQNKTDWYHSLLRYAINGLDKADSLFDVTYDLAKWLYWIDLYELPESKRKAEIKNILVQYIQEKNNGFVTRLLKGKDKEVFSQIGRIIKLASSKSDEKSLSLFQRIREKIKNNRYKNKIRILDAILHEYSCSASMCITPQKNINLHDLLPEGIEDRIKEKQGRKKVFPFANVLINKVIAMGGRARLGRNWFTTQGFKNPTKTNERIKLLIAAGVIIRGHDYAKGRFAKEFSIPDSLLKEHWSYLAK